MLSDVLFWVLFGIIGAVLAIALRGPIEQVKSAAPGSDLTLGNLAAHNEILQSAFTTGIISLIVFWLLVIIAYTLSRGLVWLTLTGKPASRLFFLRFSLMNLIWCTAWMFLFLGILTSTPQRIGPYIFFALIFLYTHLTSVLHQQHSSGATFREAFGNTFAIGMGKAGRFVHVYCYAFVIYVILSQPSRFAQGMLQLVIVFLMLLVFMAWYRTFMRNVLRKTA